MEKNIVRAMNWRSSVKEYDREKDISKEDLSELLEALRLSPSSYGLQPWKFIIIPQGELRNKLLSAAYNQEQVRASPYLIVFCAKTKINEQDVEEFVKKTAEVREVSKESLEKFKEGMIKFVKGSSDEELRMWAHEQTFIALGVLITSAAIKEIDASPMGGFNKGEFDRILELKKEGYESVALCAIGYRSENDKYAKLKKVRFDKGRVIEEIE